MLKPVGWFLVSAVLGMTLLAARSGYSVYGDFLFRRDKQDVSVPPAVFPHWFHRIRYACSVCHPTIAPMEHTSGLITMEKIAQGQFCGACHNGKAAFAVSFETCTRCHPGS